MGVKFSAAEILEIAERIEENGIRFYKEAARKFPTTDAKTALLKLS